MCINLGVSTREMNECCIYSNEFVETHFKNMAVPVLLIVLAIAFHDLVILKICLTFNGRRGSSSSLLKSSSSSPVLALGPAEFSSGRFLFKTTPQLLPTFAPCGSLDEEAAPGARIFLAIEQPILNILLSYLLRSFVQLSNVTRLEIIFYDKSLANSNDSHFLLFA